MAVTSATSTTGSSAATAESQSGVSSLTSKDFLKLLITQLQNQDPTDPMSNEEMLSQLSMIRDLQSNIELDKTLATMTESLSSNSASQQLSTAASLIGKSIVGTNSDGETVTGVVDRAFLEDGKVFVEIGLNRVELSQISSIEESAAA